MFRKSYKTCNFKATLGDQVTNMDLYQTFGEIAPRVQINVDKKKGTSLFGEFSIQGPQMGIRSDPQYHLLYRIDIKAKV